MIKSEENNENQERAESVGVDILEQDKERLDRDSNQIVKDDVSEINHKDVLSRLDEYFEGKDISSIKSKIIRIASIAGLAGTMGASLVGCNNKSNLKEDGIVSSIPPITESLGDKNVVSESSQNIVSYKENETVNYKDINLDEIEQWKQLSPEKTEKTEKIIQTTSETEIILMPVQDDYFYSSKESPTIWKLPAGSNIEIKDIYYFEGEDGKIARFSVLPNVMASKSIPVIFLDNGHMEQGSYVIDGKNYEEKEEVLSTFSYIVGADEVYPNKVINILTAMQQIAERQERNGKFIKGQEYSYIDLINLKDLGIFMDGFTSSRTVVKGGGVCAGATLLSNTLYELGVNQGISYDSIVKEKWAHSSKYFLGPFSVNDFVTDATVQLSNIPGEKSYDFRWIQPKDAYLKIDISMIPNELGIEETEPSGVGGKSDVELIITLSFTETDPGEQTQKIKEFISAYEEYRNSNHMDISSLLGEGEYVKKVDWDDPTYQVIMEYIYPEERIEYFQEELEKEEYLSKINKLKDVVNVLPASFNDNLGDYLRSTDWYRSLENKEDINRSLDMLNIVKIDGQPLQCVGFVSLLSALRFEELNVQNVSGGHSFGFGSSPARTAAELVPFPLVENRYLQIYNTGYGGVALGSEDMGIGDYEVGDLFVRTDIGKTNNGTSPNGEKITFQTGHIGAIIGKKIVDGEVILLVADANRKNDGKIRIFEVTEHNFYKIFGDPEVKKFIIRAASRGEL